MRRLSTLALALAALAVSLPVTAQDAFPQLQTTLPGPTGQQQGMGQQGYGQQQAMPNPQQMPQGQQGFGQQQAAVDPERRDFGVPPTPQLHQGPMHGFTPASIPGGQVITTQGLVELLQRQDMPTLVFDILGGPQTLPGAIPAVPAHQPGSFNDQVQQEFGNYLQQVTRGNNETPLVFYCLNPECWMSYNAALRAINLGYKNVLWYRGGIEAWQQNGQRTVQAGMAQQ